VASCRARGYRHGGRVGAALLRLAAAGQAADLGGAADVRAGGPGSGRTADSGQKGDASTVKNV
jgi:hypothetical protein